MMLMINFLWEEETHGFNIPLYNIIVQQSYIMNKSCNRPGHIHGGYVIACDDRDAIKKVVDDSVTTSSHIQPR